ncbi:hypothetical protein L665_04936 [Ralstonia solanacearum SD54]|nr:hypothetical protein F504_3397 [Ralstonia pseudosolanacearum FQY_4]ANH31291.1 hypothetical protein A3768_0099 [Ralstonia solanacearum]ESS51588.1 hypothetical protein L665_04936 [Ralstonia solanacearum SD54]
MEDGISLDLPILGRSSASYACVSHGGKVHTAAVYPSPLFPWSRT